jgi:hypothetical protein
MNDERNVDFIFDNGETNPIDAFAMCMLDDVPLVHQQQPLSFTESPSLTFLSTEPTSPVALSTHTLLSEPMIPPMQLDLPEAVEQQINDNNTLVHARIQFNGNNQYWILTHAFFCDDPNRERKQRRKKFFERWLKKNFGDSRQDIRGTQLAVLRTQRYVPSSCNTATIVPLTMFDEIAAAFNASRARDSIAVTRQQINWQDVFV